MGLAVTLLSHHFSIKGVSALLLFYFSSFSFSTNQPINKYLVETISEPFNLIKETSLSKLLLFIRKSLPPAWRLLNVKDYLAVLRISLTAKFRLDVGAGRLLL